MNTYLLSTNPTTGSLCPSGVCFYTGGVADVKRLEDATATSTRGVRPSMMSHKDILGSRAF